MPAPKAEFYSTYSYASIYSPHGYAAGILCACRQLGEPGGVGEASLRRIALIAQQMLTHEQCGLNQVCLDAAEEKLLQAFETLLFDYDGTTREQWVGLKESCLILLGSHIASCVYYLISELRTPAMGGGF
jgi:hypothetical protein